MSYEDKTYHNARKTNYTHTLKQGRQYTGAKRAKTPPFNMYQSFSGKILPQFLVFTLFVAQKMTKLGKFSAY